MPSESPPKAVIASEPSPEMFRLPEYMAMPSKNVLPFSGAAIELLPLSTIDKAPLA